LQFARSGAQNAFSASLKDLLLEIERPRGRVHYERFTIWAAPLWRICLL